MTLGRIAFYRDRHFANCFRRFAGGPNGRRTHRHSISAPRSFITFQSAESLLVDMESMLRYEFCVHALIVLAFLHFLRQFRIPPVLVRAFGMAAVALVGAAGLSVQGWYVWNFTRGNWVA